MSPVPDPVRLRHLQSALASTSLEAVAEAVAVASQSPCTVYVDRDAAGWRWSPATPGGPYPMLRVTARFLLCDHSRIQVGFRTLDSGWCVLGRPDEEREIRAVAMLGLDAPVSPAEAARLIRDALGSDDG